MKTVRSLVCGVLVLAPALAWLEGGFGRGDWTRAILSGALLASKAASEVDIASQPSSPPEVRPSAVGAKVHLEAPTLQDWKPRYPAAPAASLPARFTRLAVVTATQVPLYPEPVATSPVGYASLGNRLPAHPASIGACKGGQWYEVTGGAYLCSGDGAKIEERSFQGRLFSDAERLRMPSLERIDPFEHVKARKGAPLLSRAPSPAEVRQVVAGKVARGLLREDLNGTYLLTIIRRLVIGEEPFLQTRAGNFLRVADVDKPLPDSPMHGAHLGGERALPLGFAFQDTELYCPSGGALVVCGEVDKHARFSAAHLVRRHGRKWVRLRQGLVPREDVRIARRVERPRGVGDDERWIHIDLGEQSLVAYRGDEPVFATLVSTGKPGKDTPDGLFQVWAKYRLKTMRGHDEDGPYSVQEVPWTMYFHHAYAVHGAYWHDVFGQTRSHGCVNVPPADARWLFYWSRPTLPRGWSAMVHVKGMHVYITGKSPKPEQETAGA